MIVILIFLLAVLVYFLNNPKKIELMIILGSGGHTTEMFNLISKIDQRKTRVYVVARSDSNSMSKIKEFQQSTFAYSVVKIERSRSVKQYWITTPISFLISLCNSCFILFNYYPKVLICNGPGTCVPICLVVSILNCLRLKKIKILFIESFARVNDLSFSGKILYHLADEFIIQWEEIMIKYPKAKYLGQLM